MVRIDPEKKLIELMGRYRDLVFSVSLKITGDYFAAEDITQETFLSAYQHLTEFDGASEKAWLCRIAANRSIDYLRAAARRTSAAPEEELAAHAAEPRDGPLERYLAKEVMEDLKTNCGGLSEPYRTPAILHFIEGLTAREIAERSGVPLKTVQTRIYRARGMLKKKLRKEDLTG